MANRLLDFLKEPTTASIAKGSFIVLLFKVIGALGGYVLLFSLSATGGEREVGVYEVAFTLILIGSTIGRWGLDTVLVKALGQQQMEDAPSRPLYLKLFTRVLGVSILISAGTFALAATFTDLFFDQTPTAVITTAAIAIVPFTLMLFNAEAYRGLHKPLLFSLNQHGTVYLVIAVLLLIAPWSDWSGDAMGSAQLALIALVALSTLFFLLSFQHILRLCSPHAPVPKAYSRGLFAAATPMLISSALFLVMSWSDTLMLSYYLPEESVGVYRIAFKITTLITFAQFALNTVVTPMIAGLHSGGSGMGHLAKRVATLNLYTAGPIFLVIVLFGPFLIGLFGVESAVQAYPWLLILALGQLANAFAGPVLNVLNMTGYEKSARNTMLVMATVNIVLNALLIPLMGPLGAAIATASTMIGWNLWAGILVYKYHGLITVPFLAKKNSV